MRVHHPLLSAVLAGTVLAALAGCAGFGARVERGEAAPMAPQDESDRVSSAPSNRVEIAGVPEWLRIRLADYDAQTGAGAPRAVHALAYGSGTAYLVTAGCCDQLDPLIDSSGTLICHPSGGYTGRGDGKCPGRLPPADQQREVWRHR
jgi:hypothetical protein